MKTRLDITGLSHFWQKILSQLQDKKTIQTAVTDPTASGVAVAFIDSISQNTQGVIVPTKKTVPNASQSSAGLMSAEDKLKLDAVETGAQVNTVTGVKGDAEASYRQGNVNLTPANIGALASTTAILSGSEYTAVLHTGQFILGILVGQFRDPGDSPNNGYCIVFVYNDVAYMSQKFGLSGTYSVSYSNGVLTVNSSYGYMNYAFIKLM